MNKKKAEEIKKAKQVVDFETGLSMQQVQAAKLMAQGWTMNRSAKAVGVHPNTVSNWYRKYPAFKVIVQTYKVLDMECITKPIDDLTPEELDLRLVKLVGPAILAFEQVLKDRKAGDMAKVQAAKYVFSTLYLRLTQSRGFAPKELEDLRSTLGLALK